jgi:tRNA pseudouridine55 synthase
MLFPNRYGNNDISLFLEMTQKINESTGVLNVRKPEDWTSQDVCAKLRSRLHIKKIGHTGTLDPMATGVLPVCIGKATRIIEYYDADKKSYHACMKLGVVTDTLDITGETLETHSFSDVSEKAVIEAFNAYTGAVEQLPPKYSALKINGKRAYELAREGKEFELKKRKIYIFSNEISRLDMEKGEIEFDVCCSKGTYIRTICDDIGRALGCGGVMTALTRTGSGFFRLEDAADIRDLAEMSDEDIMERIIPADRTLVSLGIIELNDNRVTAFSNGNSSHLYGCRIIEDSHFDDIFRVYGEGRFLGIGAIIDNELVPQKVFK